MGGSLLIHPSGFDGEHRLLQEAVGKKECILPRGSPLTEVLVTRNLENAWRFVVFSDPKFYREWDDNKRV